MAVLSLVVAGFVQDQQRPLFRSETILVPIDVRVTDRQGRPIPDLKASDFTIYEDDVPQKVVHFAAHSLSASAAPTLAAPPVSTNLWLEKENTGSRTFAIVLGRGRLQHPAMGVDALIEFVSQHLLPQDWVTLVAYQRATDFTKDRDGIVRVLERYRTKHPEIEARLQHWFSDLQGAYGSSLMPRHIAASIDSIFDGPDMPRVRQLAYGAPAEGQIEDHRTALVEGLDPSTRQSAMLYHTAARHELEALYAAIEYLRPIQGEKHLVFVTETAFEQFGGGATNILADMAADARVAISVIQTGGVPTSWTAKSWNRPPQIKSRTWLQAFGIEDAKFVSVSTGGFASMYRRASDALRDLDAATRQQYVLAYHPSNQTWDGGRRRIRVTVRVPGASVTYRRVYFANQQLAYSDRAEFVKAIRIATAATYRRPIGDLPITLSVPNKRASAAELPVDLRIDVSKVRLPLEDARYVGSLEIAVYLGDARERPVGGVQQRLDLKLSEKEYQAMRRDGLRHTVVIKVSNEPRHVKAVVYDAEADLLGTAVLDLRRR